MNKLEDLPAHLKSLQFSDWQKLFDLLPVIERTGKFGVMKGNEKSADGVNIFPYWEQAPVVSKFTEVVYDMDIVPVFDWSSWEEGREILERGKQDFSRLDLVTLCKLITVIVRADRFSDGTLIGNFENGTIKKIISGMQNILLK